MFDDFIMNSEYTPVSQKEMDCAPPATKAEMSYSQSESRMRTVKLLLAIIGCLSAVATCILVVVILHLFEARLEIATTSRCPTTTDDTISRTSPDMVHMQYGHQYEYMSLDPQYDHLWDNYTARTAVVRLNDIKETNDDREQKIGAISM